jgi:isocitrate lyase
MDAQYDGTELCFAQTRKCKIKTFQMDGAREPGIFHHPLAHLSHDGATYE